MYLLVLYALAVPLNKPAEAILSAVLMLLFVCGFKRGAYSENHSAYIYAVVSYFLADAASSLFNFSEPADALHIVRQLPLFIGVMILLMTDKKKIVDMAITAFVVSTLLVAAAAVYQYVFTDVFRPPSFRNAVHIGYVFNYSMALLFAAIFYAHKSIKIWSAAAFVLTAAAMMAGETRGAWVSIIAAIVVLTLCAPFVRKREVILSVLVITTALLLLPQVRARIDDARRDIAYYSGNIDSATSLGRRFVMWKASLQMFRDHPLIGVGPRNWQKEVKAAAAHGEISNDITTFNQPHSMYLHALATKGIAGLAALLFLACAPLYLVWKRKMLGTYYGDALFMVALLFLLQGFTETVPSMYYPFRSYLLLVGLLLAGSRINQGLPVTSETSRTFP